jgi:uncharacterized protein YcnI
MPLLRLNAKLTAVVTAFTLLAVVATASAHVAVTAGAAAGEIVLSVPNESASADTISVAMQLPDNVVRTRVPDLAGWTHTETTVPLDPPLRVDGVEVASRVTTVTWTGGRIAPGREAEFRLRLAVAEGTKRTGLAFPAVQRYSDGDVVRWIGGPGSEFPAGVLETSLPAVAAVAVTTSPATTTSTQTATVATSTTTTTGAGSGSTNPIGLIFAVIGAAIATGGVIAIIRWRQARADQTP